MSLEGILGFFKAMIGFLLFPFFVLSNIFLHIVMEPFNELWPKRKWLFFLLTPIIAIPWLLNFAFFELWEKLFD